MRAALVIVPCACCIFDARFLQLRRVFLIMAVRTSWYDARSTIVVLSILFPWIIRNLQNFNSHQNSVFLSQNGYVNQNTWLAHRQSKIWLNWLRYESPFPKTLHWLLFVLLKRFYCLLSCVIKKIINFAMCGPSCAPTKTLNLIQTAAWSRTSVFYHQGWDPQMALKVGVFKRSLDSKLVDLCKN